ncbi:MAG TPA: hypothetical protein VKB39_02470 [Candidatus Baltobacteraceae bacterium]|nr:hypothetical protein [Candidatus Baltobacteraceae bacterium]
MNRLTNAAVLAIAALAAAVATGCSAASSGGNSAGGGDFLTDGHAVVSALDAIAAKSGTPMRITNISADGVSGLSVDVQEPKNHINVDRYVVASNGSITGPTPVKLMSLDGGPVTAASVDQQAFDPKTVGFVRLSTTVKEAIAKSHYSDAHVNQWEIGGTGPDDRRYLYLESERARPVAILRRDLTIADMRY